MLSAPVRLSFLTASLICLGALAAACSLQRWAYLPPCPLCNVQRALLAAIAVVSLIAALHAPARRGARAYALGNLGLCLLGAGSALRQLWLQAHLDPAQALDFLNAEHVFTPSTGYAAAKVYVLGTPDCGIVNWSLLGLTLPEWSLLSFCMLGALAIYPLFRR
ncbi:disulfide bond formation protein B [Pseudomonas typographi]|uniref:Disulfide bond formation protein B n=1 Tax=Pseudomonas typographi TaxID=2715964 RepID=A0ABR7Z393_9PSED|nr:disulfide bond formation protein B [Pseudomonas typographi]MBD1550176.1 disulfide bond formation protein B [Pseudomonas typographi]MBD1586064.1 disulfide bond formation protein B [Pseudomonas typographi]MBD1599922.1 disulfide bond formation protein B [Pseudomonas typographi]